MTIAFFFILFFSDLDTNTILALENELKSFPSVSMVWYSLNNIGNACYLKVRYSSATKSSSNSVFFSRH